jgi:acid stress-induced BolA-like protein IbaG/YrbA
LGINQETDHQKAVGFLLGEKSHFLVYIVCNIIAKMSEFRGSHATD